MKKLVSLALLCISSSLNAQITDTLISVGDHCLNFRIIEGTGTPIVFESCAGNDGSVWREVMLLLSKKINVPLIAYDRAGFGKSGIDTLNININNEIDDLRKGLNKLGFGDNYFLVAHSLGSCYAMKFAIDNPNRVKGTVFIDAINPYFLTQERASLIKSQFMDDIMTIKKESIGFYHLILNYENTAKVMRECAQSFNVPLTIIASGITPFEEETRVEFINGLKKFSDELDNRSYILVNDAEHFVFYDEPELVANEIVKSYDKFFASIGK